MSERMTLKDTIIGRAEDLTPEERKKHNLPETGLIIIEIHNTKLNEKYISIEKKGGMSAYLRSLAKFKKVDISEKA